MCRFCFLFQHVGKVLQIEGKGDSAKLIVYFDSVGRRKLIAKYANLDVL